MLHAEDALDQLRARGMRVTPQRRAVINTLVDNTSHPSPDEVAASVQERLPDVSLSTIYATLHEFAEMGLLRRLDTQGSMRFDPETNLHSHLSCIECGKVVDVDVPTEVLGALAVAAGTPANCTDVVLHSVCSACSASST